MKGATKQKITYASPERHQKSMQYEIVSRREPSIYEG